MLPYLYFYIPFYRLFYRPLFDVAQAKNDVLFKVKYARVVVGFKL